MTPVDFNPFPLGIIAPTSGSPLSVLSNFPDLQYSHGKSLVVRTLANTGSVYVGRSNMNRATGVGVVAIIPANSRQSIPENDLQTDQLQFEKFYIDVDTTGDKALVTGLFG